MGDMASLGRASWQRSVKLCASWFSKTSWQSLRGRRAPANFAVLLSALLLASCATTVAEAPPVPLIAEPYDIAEVDVILSKSIAYGAEMIDGSSQKEFAERVRASLKQKLTADLVQPKSSRKPIRLEVVLDKVDLSSGIGRAVLKSESNIGGFVSLIDKRTKTALARRKSFHRRRFHTVLWRWRRQARGHICPGRLGRQCGSIGG